MSTNLEYRARQASEGQREKGRQRSRAMDKNFFFWRTTWKFCSDGDKMRNAGSQQANARWTWGAVKKSELVRTRTPFPPLSVSKKFLEVSLCSHAKQRQRNVQKTVLHVQSCFFANQTYCCPYHRSLALPLPLSITQCYILFEQTINIIECFAF